MKTNQTEKKKAVRFFSITMAILLVCSIFIWGFQTAWGKVKIERIYINSQDGTDVSSLIYIPENATDETPAPVAVIYHGRSNHAHSNDTWSGVRTHSTIHWIIQTADITGSTIITTWKAMKPCIFCRILRPTSRRQSIPAPVPLP